jgi:hypothetical protein
LSTGTTKSYISNIEYIGVTVESIYHPEGRARNNAGNYVYDNTIKNQLGNDHAKIVEEFIYCDYRVIRVLVFLLKESQSDSIDE